MSIATATGGEFEDISFGGVALVIDRPGESNNFSFTPSSGGAPAAPAAPSMCPLDDASCCKGERGG